MKCCVVCIHRPGKLDIAANDMNVPAVWFPSMATMAAVLSEDNRALLCIRAGFFVRRQAPNLSRTLRMMADYGLVGLKRNVREIESLALATELLVVQDRRGGRFDSHEQHTA